MLSATQPAADPADALAEPTLPEAVASKPVSAQFLTLDRQDGASQLTVDLGYTNFDTGDESVFPLRFGFYGQYVAPSGVGGYANFAANIVSGDGETLKSLSNLELGGLYAGKLGTVEGVARASLVLPTAPDDEDGFAGLIAGVSRVTDTPLIYPETTWIRLGASPLVRRDNFVFRADAGVDLAIDTPENFDVDPIFRLNLAIGLVQGQHQVSAEVVNSFSFGDDSDRVHSIGASYRASLGSSSPFIGVFRAFGEDGFSEDLRFSLIGGITASLGG